MLLYKIHEAELYWHKPPGEVISPHGAKIVSGVG